MRDFALLRVGRRRRESGGFVGRRELVAPALGLIRLALPFLLLLALALELLAALVESVVRRSGQSVSWRKWNGADQASTRSRTAHPVTLLSMIRQPSRRHVSIAAISVGHVALLQYARCEPWRPIRKSTVQRFEPRTWKVRGVIVKPLYRRSVIFSYCGFI